MNQDHVPPLGMNDVTNPHTPAHKEAVLDQILEYDDSTDAPLADEDGLLRYGSVAVWRGGTTARVYRADTVDDDLPQSALDAVDMEAVLDAEDPKGCLTGLLEDWVESLDGPGPDVYSKTHREEVAEQVLAAVDPRKGPHYGSWEYGDLTVQRMHGEIYVHEGSRKVAQFSAAPLVVSDQPTKRLMKLLDTLEKMSFGSVGWDLEPDDSEHKSRVLEEVMGNANAYVASEDGPGGPWYYDHLIVRVEAGTIRVYDADEIAVAWIQIPDTDDVGEDWLRRQLEEAKKEAIDL